jgi:aspartate-semialdehyde dehydrogenase
MVGSVLMQRMLEEKDFGSMSKKGHVFRLYSSNREIIGTSIQLKYYSDDPSLTAIVRDSNDLSDLCDCDIIVTCQGSGWSKKVYPKLINEHSWKGIWLDASSAFRQEEKCVIVLDPLNRDIIKKALDQGGRLFAGGNCTVSLMLMALAGLFKNDLIEWVSSMTYQAASGAGAKNMLELGRQMGFLSKNCGLETADDALKMEERFTACLRDELFPKENFGHPLAGNLLPYIDSMMNNGQSREEWKGEFETNKILGLKPGKVHVDGICVRAAVMRCHSQALTIKLKKDVPLEEIKGYISSEHDWVRIVPDNKEATLSFLTPAAVSGKLIVRIGRLRKLNFGPEYLGAFTVGDQLLWGAAEPIRRALKIIVEN